MLKLQGEYRIQLRELEDSLLQNLSQAVNNILEDPEIFSTLERIKRQAFEIETKMKQSEEVHRDVLEAAAVYSPVATACSRIYFTMEHLRDISPLYQFSFETLLEVLFSVLRDDDGSLKEVPSAANRVEIIRSRLFQRMFDRLRHSLLFEDHLPLALRFAQVYLQDGPDELPRDELDLLMRGATSQWTGDRSTLSFRRSDTVPAVSWLSRGQRASLEEALAAAPSLAGLVPHLTTNAAEWEELGVAENAESRVPTGWEFPEQTRSPSRHVAALRRLLVLKVMRPDRLSFGCSAFVTDVFGTEFLAPVEANLMGLIASEPPSVPLLFCCQRGYDASSRVESFAMQSGKRLRSLAMGSEESFDEVDKAIANATRTGEWILVKNIHLAPTWMSSLEKRLRGYRLEGQLRPQFRLFLTMEITGGVPSSLIRWSHSIVQEPPPGVKASLLRCFSSLPPDRTDSAPVERSRLHWALSWLHATVLERLRFVPMGWSKGYEFSEADLVFAADAIDAWLTSSAKGRQHVTPSEIPWKALRQLLAACIYGGRIDNEFDGSILSAFVDKLFCAASFAPGTVLAVHGEGKTIEVPSGMRHADFLDWIRKLPSVESPAWVGLRPCVQGLLRTREGDTTVRRLLLLQTAYEDESVMEETQDGVDEEPSMLKGSRIVDFVKGWWTRLHRWAAPVWSSDCEGPVDRFLAREVQLCGQLHSTILSDVQSLHQSASEAGTRPLTNEAKRILDSLLKGEIPPQWAGFKVPASLGAGGFVGDLVKRIKVLSHVVVQLSEGHQTLHSMVFWLGGLFSPQGFLTATRQMVCRGKGWSLEDMTMEVEVGADLSVQDEQSFLVSGLVVQGASWDKVAGTLVSVSADAGRPTPEQFLPVVRIRWTHGAPAQATATRNTVVLPLYLNDLRRELLCQVRLPVAAHVEPTVWHELGTALIAWHHDYDETGE